MVSIASRTSGGGGLADQNRSCKTFLPLSQQTMGSAPDFSNNETRGGDQEVI